MDEEFLEEEGLEDQDLDMVSGAWSYSKLSKWAKCRKEGLYRYGPDKDKGVPSGAFAFGKAVHETIQLVHDTKAFKGSEWYAIWAEKWAEHAASVDWEHEGQMKTRKKTYDKLGPEGLGRYIPMNQGAVVIGSEIQFGKKDDAESQHYLGSHLLAGFIDQVRRLRNGAILVVDFKTGKMAPDYLGLRTNPQFTMYHKVAKDLYPEDEIIMAWYQFRDAKNPWHFTSRNTTTDYQDVIDMLDETKQYVDEGRFTRNIGFHCNWCDYREKCLGGREDLSEVEQATMKYLL